DRNDKSPVVGHGIGFRAGLRQLLVCRRLARNRDGNSQEHKGDPGEWVFPRANDLIACRTGCFGTATKLLSRFLEESAHPIYLATRSEVSCMTTIRHRRPVAR